MSPYTGITATRNQEPQMTPIQAVVEPQRAQAIARAKQFAIKHAETVLAGLEAAGWDLNAFAPMPRGTMGRAEYAAAAALRQVAAELTEPRQATIRHGEPNLRSRSEAGVERFVVQACIGASLAYDEFIVKLNDKVGQHSDASIAGSHVWGYSVLTVTTPAGVQRWKTQQIVNVSKLGRVFNQWPTRLMK